MNKYEILKDHVFVTKLAGFEHTEFIQNNETRNKIDKNDIPLVQGKNIRNGRFVEKYDWFIKKNISDKLIRSKLNKRCILIPYVGSNLGEVGIFEHPYDCHMASNIAKVELIDDYFDLDFLKFYLQSDIGQAYLFQSKQGSAQPNITMESIRNTMIIDIEKKDQIKIAKFLKMFDDKIILNEKNIDISMKLLNTIFDYWFFQYKYTENVELIWNEELNKNIPKEWIVKELNDLLIENEKSKTQVGMARNEKGNIPFFTSGEEILRVEKKMVSGRNLFLNTGGNADVKFYTGDAAYSTDTWCVTFGSYTDYIYVYLSKMKDILNNSFFMGSGLKHLQKDQFRKLNVLLPDDNTLSKFNKIAFDLNNNISNLMDENYKLTKIKNDLISLIINGQINIKEVE